MRPRGNPWLVLFASPILAACAAGSSLGDSSNITGAGGSIGTSTASSITQSGGNGTASGGTGGSSGSFTTTGTATGGGTSTGTNSGGGSGTATSVGGGSGTSAGGGSGTSGTAAGGASGTGTSTNSGPTSTAASTAASTVASTVASTGASSSTGGSCAGQTTSAQLVPLDLYIMQDKSGSMSEDTGTGSTKWAAVSSALKAFFNDPNSAGLGVGIQFFPLFGPGTPDTCYLASQCPGTSAPCWLKTCQDNNYNTTCTANNQCFPNKCGALGYCTGDTSYICDFAGTATHCLNAGGVDIGTCAAVDAAHPSTCVGAGAADSCLATDYTTPAVEIGTLPGNATALGNAINGHSPNGGTPTLPALQGTINHAKAWATAHSGHKVVAVLATDGIPSDCDTTCMPLLASGATNPAYNPTTCINNVAAVASGGVGNGISTFVIGIFSPADAGAQANLDQIAAAGGTTKAFIVDTTQNVTTQFQAALQTIRGQQLPCTFQIPQPASGSIDYGKVNVIYTDGGGTKTTIYYTSNLAGCDPSAGGWYYDVDPTTGGTPNNIEMCPKSCTQLQSGGSVDIEVGCTTIIKPGG